MQRIPLQQKRMEQRMHNSHVTALNAGLVEVSIGNDVVAKAVRADTESDWHIGTLVELSNRSERTMMNVAQIHSSAMLSETRQRKLVLAMLQSLADSL